MLGETAYSSETNNYYVTDSYRGSCFGSTSNDAVVNWLVEAHHLGGGNYAYMARHVK